MLESNKLQDWKCSTNFCKPSFLASKDLTKRDFIKSNKSCNFINLSLQELNELTNFLKDIVCFYLAVTWSKQVTRRVSQRSLFAGSKRS